MNSRKVFTYQSQMPGDLEDLVAIHQDPDALKHLTPPPLIVQVRRDTRVGLTQGNLDFILWFGPLPIPWQAVHEPGPTPYSFVDRMVSGPMAYWEHTHILDRGEDDVHLSDRVVYQHRRGLVGLFTRLFFGGPALRMLFAYRHWKTRKLIRRREVSIETSPSESAR